MLSVLRGLRFMVGCGPATGLGGFPSGGGAASFDEILAAIDAAWLVEREPDDDGPRIAIISPALRGSFFFTREEAARRIGIAFPGAEPAVVMRALRHLENRIFARSSRVARNHRRNWVQDWKEDRRKRPD